MKKVSALFLAIIFSTFFIGCHSSRSVPNGYSYGMLDPQPSSDQYYANERGGLYLEDEIKIERKILFSAYLSLIVEHPDTANVYIEKIAKKYNGYIKEIGTYRTVIRVESKNLDPAIEEISQLGKVQSKSVSGQDVTDEYFDFKIRLENAEKSRDRYLELLARAENVQAALTVEKELERLNGTIDLLKGKMNRIDHLSEFSTITINLKEKKKPGLLGYIGIGLYRSVKWLFVRN